jgi:hypothetical protein
LPIEGFEVRFAIKAKDLHGLFIAIIAIAVLAEIPNIAIFSLQTGPRLVTLADSPARWKRSMSWSPSTPPRRTSPARWAADHPSAPPCRRPALDDRRGTDCLWYPTMRIVRPKTRQDFAGPVDHIRKAVHQVAPDSRRVSQRIRVE